MLSAVKHRGLIEAVPEDRGTARGRTFSVVVSHHGLIEAGTARPVVTTVTHGFSVAMNLFFTAATAEPTHDPVAGHSSRSPEVLRTWLCPHDAARRLRMRFNQSGWLCPDGCPNASRWKRGRPEKGGRAADPPLRFVS
jgi:hypothetical protein